jgi:5-methylcytosine-specific restriction endonuclease McrA
MPRRKPVHRTGISGTGKVDYTTVWRVFECYRPGCDNFIKVSEDWLREQKEKGNPIKIICPKCNYEIPEEIIERAPRWKYCRICEWLQPLENFHKHKPISWSFRSGRQLECKFCKNLLINPTLNPLRTSDQFRESSQRRRLYNILSEEIGKINSKKVFEKFESKCFNCGKKLTYQPKGIREWTLDHTLPAKYLWPLNTDNATLLCNECNNEKHDKWPSEVYSKQKLRRLAVLTGYPYELLSGPPKINPKALQKILANVDKFIEDWIGYPEDIKKIRALILEMEGIDIFEKAKYVPDYLRN